MPLDRPFLLTFGRRTPNVSDVARRFKTSDALTNAQRTTLIFEAIKLVSGGNGAGVIASLAAMYYFRDDRVVQIITKIAAILYHFYIRVS